MTSRFRPHPRNAAAIASLGMVAAFVWACSNGGPTPSPTASSTATESPAASVLAATLEPSASSAGSVGPSPSASASASPAGSAAGSGSVVGVVRGRQAAPTVPAGPPAPRTGVNVSIVAAGDIACDPAHNVGTPQD